MRPIDADALIEKIRKLPTAGMHWWVSAEGVFKIILEAPTIEPERKKGKWKEKHHAYSDEEDVIEEWQSCQCSVCGRYDTRPYMYYFSEPRYCSWCGADMRGDSHENV